MNELTADGILIISEPITRAKASEIGASWYAEMTKGVVDIEKGIIALGGEYHMDANVVLVGKGSSQADVWGFNVYPDKDGDDWIEYRSMINIRPVAGNRTMYVEDEALKKAMREIVERLIV